MVAILSLTSGNESTSNKLCIDDHPLMPKFSEEYFAYYTSRLIKPSCGMSTYTSIYIHKPFRLLNTITVESISNPIKLYFQNYSHHLSSTYFTVEKVIVWTLRWSNMFTQSQDWIASYNACFKTKNADLLTSEKRVEGKEIVSY
jgi:hypothetical protein